MLFIIEICQRDHPNMVRDTFAGSDNTKLHAAHQGQSR